MCKEMLKGLLKIKLKAVDSAIDFLPPEIKSKAADFQKNLIVAAYEVTEEFLTDKPDEYKKNKGITPINID
jgi:hypothetical protein